MASISRIQDVPLAGRWSKFITKGDDDFVPEFQGSPEDREKWYSNVIIPFGIGKATHALGGPLQQLEALIQKVNTIFPGFKTCEPRVFNTAPYNFEYLKHSHKSFRFEPKFGHEAYVPWLNRVQKAFLDVWMRYGIYELIQLSRKPLEYQPDMLMAAFHFFEKSTNTFQFRCGMLTPTLFDVAAITGLSPLGKSYNPADSNNTVQLKYKENAFTKCIAENNV
jgi:hypothetical protein